jgi:hypothetical protein
MLFCANQVFDKILARLKNFPYFVCSLKNAQMISSQVCQLSQQGAVKVMELMDCN